VIGFLYITKVTMKAYPVVHMWTPKHRLWALRSQSRTIAPLLQ